MRQLKKVQMIQTTDGRNFDDAKDAEEHQNFLNFIERVNFFLDGEDYTDKKKDIIKNFFIQDNQKGFNLVKSLLKET